MATPGKVVRKLCAQPNGLQMPFDIQQQKLLQTIDAVRVAAPQF
jgi:hypothetical protein